MTDTRPGRTLVVLDNATGLHNVRAMEGEPGVAVRVFLSDDTELGTAHLPPPVKPGDLIALEDGLPLRVIAVEPTPGDPHVEALVEVLWERRSLFSRGDSAIRLPRIGRRWPSRRRSDRHPREKG